MSLLNENIEAAVLGAPLVNPDLTDLIVQEAKPDYFFGDINKKLYGVIKELYLQDTVVDTLIVQEKSGIKPDILKHYILHASTSGTTTKDYINILKENYTRRKLKNVLESVLERIESDDLGELMAQTEEGVYGLSTSTGRSLAHVSDILASYAEKTRDTRGLKSGFRYLDSILGGFQKSDLVILAARPSVGKTAYSLDIARQVALSGAKVAVFSLEMSTTQLTDRLLAIQAGVNLWNLRLGTANPTQLERISTAMGELSEIPLYIDDTPGIGIAEIRTKTRKLKAQHGLDLIIVDYLQLMQGGKSESRVQEVSEISRSLKALARDLDIPVIALSQLSRSVEQRGGDGVPQLSDLRDSGSIEQDADVVIFLNKKEDGETRQMTIAKHRNGPTGAIDLYFKKDQVQFVEIE